MPDATTISSAAFAFGQWQLGGAPAAGRCSPVCARGRAAPQCRSRRLAAGTVEQDQTSSAWSGNVGLVFTPAAAWALTVNLGRAWRRAHAVRALRERPHIGEARYELGDSTLDPESNRAIDVGVRWRSARTPAGADRLSQRDLRLHLRHADRAGHRFDCPSIQYVQAEAELLGEKPCWRAAIGKGLILRGRADSCGARISSRTSRSRSFRR